MVFKMRPGRGRPLGEMRRWGGERRKARGSTAYKGDRLVDPHLSDAWEYYSPRDGCRLTPHFYRFERRRPRWRDSLSRLTRSMTSMSCGDRPLGGMVLLVRVIESTPTRRITSTTGI